MKVYDANKKVQPELIYVFETKEEYLDACGHMFSKAWNEMFNCVSDVVVKYDDMRFYHEKKYIYFYREGEPNNKINKENNDN